MMKRMPEWIQILKEHYDQEYSKMKEDEGGENE